MDGETTMAHTTTKLEHIPSGFVFTPSTHMEPLKLKPVGAIEDSMFKLVETPEEEAIRLADIYSSEAHETHDSSRV